VTCHDGFTLNDLVSYDGKHNEGNGENNRDGADDNRSWNCSVEGPTDDPAVDMLRTRQVKNFLTVTMLSAGMPMMLMGDEVRRTQAGNNNAYCQDNETSWFDWTLLTKHADVYRFVTLLNAHRGLRDAEHERPRVALNDLLRQADITWHGVKVGEPDWRHSSHSVAFTVRSMMGRTRYHVILNAFWEPLEFELPSIPAGEPHPWRRWIDTHLAAPQDIVEWERAPSVPGPRYLTGPRSVVLLFAGHEPARQSPGDPP
jgi:isoamylase